MTNKEIKIAYIEYASLEELPAQDRLLADAAIEAVTLSYAPYSNFNVGAAVMFEDGEIVKGANQENAAYPSGLCAERTALFYASASRPDKAMTAIAIAAGQNGKLCESPATPCGACRQVISELMDKDADVILTNRKNDMKLFTVKDLLPFSFSKDDLNV